MQTIRLKVNDKVYDKLMWLLGKFSKDEVEVISEESLFNETKNYLQAELNEIDNGKAEFTGVEEAEIYLEKVIRKHENHH